MYKYYKCTHPCTLQAYGCTYTTSVQVYMHYKRTCTPQPIELVLNWKCPKPQIKYGIVLQECMYVRSVRLAKTAESVEFERGHLCK